MLDPFTAASSVAGLLSLTIEVTKLTHAYATGVKAAPSAIQSLQGELLGLSSVLLDIQEKIRSNPNVATVFGTTISSTLTQIESQSNRTARTGTGGNAKDFLDQCKEELNDLRRTLERNSGLKGRLLWPFTESEVRKRVDALHRYREILDSSISVDILVSVSAAHEEVRDWRKEQKHIQVLDWLSPLDFASRHRDVLAKHHPGTCAWFLNSSAYDRWANGDVGEAQLWCSGEPGAGKTILSSVVIRDLQERKMSADTAVLFIFCDHKDQLNQTPARLFGALAKQLASQCLTFPTALEVLHDKISSRAPDAHEAVQVILEISQLFKKVLVVVDALDECDNAVKRPHRKEFLSGILKLSSNDFRVFVTSRLRSLKKILEVCMGLVVFEQDSNIVRLCHHTFGQFLLQHTLLDSPPHAVLAQKLLKYLTCCRIDDNYEGPEWEMDGVLVEYNPRHPLYPYAGCYWRDHAFNYQIFLKEALVEFFRSLPTIFSIGFGEEVLESSSKFRALRNVRNIDLPWLCLLYAATLGLVQLAQHLIDEGVDVMSHHDDVKPHTIFQWLIGDERFFEDVPAREAMIECLLKGQTITLETCEDDRMALARMCTGFSINGMRMILQHGLDPNTKMPWYYYEQYSSILEMCCREGLSDHVYFLLSHEGIIVEDSRALVEAVGSINYSSDRDLHTIMRSLLSRGVDVNCVGPRGTPAIYITVLCWDRTATEILLAHGADPRRRKIDRSKQVPLSAVFDRFQKGPVNWSTGALLVRYGASISDLDGICLMPKSRRNPCVCQLILLYLREYADLCGRCQKPPATSISNSEANPSSVFGPEGNDFEAVSAQAWSDKTPQGSPKSSGEVTSSSVRLATRCREPDKNPKRLSAEDYCEAVDDQIAEVIRLWWAAYELPKHARKGYNWYPRTVKDALEKDPCSHLECRITPYCYHKCGKPLMLTASSREQCAEILGTYASRETADKKLLGKLLTVETWAADEAPAKHG